MARQSLIRSVNPATEEVIGTFEPATTAQIEQALSYAQRTYRQWRQTSFAERAALLQKAAAYLRQHQARLAGLITAEMGKPIAEAEAEVEKCAWNCVFYAENAERFLHDEPVATNARQSY